MKLDLSSLRKSLDRLKKSQSDLELAISQGQNHFQDSLKSGIIQNFEIAYELSWKFIKRWIEVNIGNEITFGITKKELFRIAGEYGLIHNVESWFEYHKIRNETSHTYDEAKANLAFEISLRFLADAESLYEFLVQQNE